MALQMCQKCVGKNFQKCEARAFYFFFLVSCSCHGPVALLIKSSQPGRKVGLRKDMSVITHHCQCVRSLFCICPNDMINIIASCQKMITDTCCYDHLSDVVQRLVPNPVRL